jgi:hypothetical protein
VSLTWLRKPIKRLSLLRSSTRAYFRAPGRNESSPAGRRVRRTPSRGNRRPGREAARLKRRYSARHEAVPGAQATGGAIIQHVAAFSGALLVVAVVTKALRVAHMDLTTAQVLLVNGDVVGVLSGMLLLFFPAFVTFGLVAAIALLLLTPIAPSSSRLKANRGILIGLNVGLLGLAVLAVPADALWQILLLIGIGLVSAAPVILLRRRMRRGKRQTRTSKPRRRTVRLILFTVWTAIAFIPLLALVFNDVVWLPPERVAISGADPIVAYEITRNDDRVLFLLEATRQVRAVPPDAVTTQQPCRLTTLLNSRPSIYALLNGEDRPRTRAC